MVRLLSLLALSLFVSAQAANTAMSQPAGDGFVVLFDGKNLDHWQGDGKAQFTIQDGAVVATGRRIRRTPPS